MNLTDETELGYSPLTFTFVSIMMAIASFSGTLFVVYFAVWHEKATTAERFLTPFNICLIVLGLSATGIHVSEAIIFQIIELEGNSSGPHAIVIYAMEAFFAATGATSYSLYSWYRAGNLARDIFPSSSVRLLQFLVFWAIPLVSLSNVILISIQTLYVTSTVLVRAIASVLLACMLLLITLDASLLAVFLLYMRKTHLDGAKTDPHLQIVARCGIAACVFMLLGMAIDAVYSTTFWEPHFEAYLILMSASFTALVLMKVLLHANKRRVSRVRANVGQRVAARPSWSEPKEQGIAPKAASIAQQRTLHMPLYRNNLNLADLTSLATVCVCSIVAIALFVGCVYFALVVERAGKQNTIKTVFSLTNSMACFGSLSIAAFSICNIFGILESPVYLRAKIPAILSQVCLSNIETAYTLFSWSRYNVVVKYTSIERYRILRRVVVVIPILTYITVTSLTLTIVVESRREQLFWIYLGCEFCVGAAILSFDILLILSFVAFLGRTVVEGEKVEADFTLLARYGSATTGLCLLVMATFLGLIADGYWRPDDTNVYPWGAALAVQFNLIFVLLMRMRMGLFWLSKEGRQDTAVLKRRGESRISSLPESAA
ncbi:hypothetical protein BC830DRAFT_1171501 [Chytriomyces sp. MP71]|nr:hypothetical protein BC830DRAFT_1171501 [Chytriomyces sp. MP71]